MIHIYSYMYCTVIAVVNHFMYPFRNISWTSAGGRGLLVRLPATPCPSPGQEPGIGRSSKGRAPVAGPGGRKEDVTENGRTKMRWLAFCCVFGSFFDIKPVEVAILSARVWDVPFLDLCNPSLPIIVGYPSYPQEVVFPVGSSHICCNCSASLGISACYVNPHVSGTRVQEIGEEEGPGAQELVKVLHVLFGMRIVRITVNILCKYIYVYVYKYDTVSQNLYRNIIIWILSSGHGWSGNVPSSQKWVTPLHGFYNNSANTGWNCCNYHRCFMIKSTI